MTESKHHQHMCPVWVGYLLASPLRAIFQNPQKILAPYVTQGMHVLDAGCAMGFFSLPMARLVGPTGRVVCVDLQQKMIDSLSHRARRNGVGGRIQTRLCVSDSLGIADLTGQIDFALAFAVVHEVPSASTLFAELYATLKPGGRLLFAEPRGRVSKYSFNESIETAEAQGFAVVGSPIIPRCHAAVLKKEERHQPSA